MENININNNNNNNSTPNEANNNNDSQAFNNLLLNATHGIVDGTGSNGKLVGENNGSEPFYDWGLLNDKEFNTALLDRLNCIHISEAIKAQGIDDFTSYAPVQIGMGIAYAALLLFGLFSNGSVLLAFVRNRRLRSSRNFFLLNLIITDILLCLTAIPITPWYAMTKDWAFGAVLCRLVPLSNSCAVFVTSWSLTAIAFDKHMHIVVEPTRRHLSRQLAGFVTFSIWFMSLVVNIPYLMSFDLVDGFYVVSEDHFAHFCGKFCDEFNWTSDSQRRFYGVIVLLFQFVIPMAVITFCHMRILHKVQKDMIVQNAQFRKTLTNSQRMDAISRKKRVNYTLMGMVLAFVGCNMPLTAVNLAKDFGQEPKFLLDQPYLCPLIAHLIAMSIVCWNPLLFYWLSGKDKSRGGSANGCLMSLGGSEPLQPGTTGCGLNSLTITNVLRRWSRGDLPLVHCQGQQHQNHHQTGQLGTAATLLMRKDTSRSHQMLTASGSSGGLSTAGGSFRRKEGYVPASNRYHPVAREQQQIERSLLVGNHLLTTSTIILQPDRPTIQHQDDQESRTAPANGQLFPSASSAIPNSNERTTTMAAEAADGGGGNFLKLLHPSIVKSNSIRSNLF